jgi:hypothetical protein
MNTASYISDTNLIPEGVGEQDAWTIPELDREPEQCFCLKCGTELPCSSCLPAYLTPTERN